MPDTTPRGDTTCLACGLLCDDIEAHIEDEGVGPRIVAAGRACGLGAAWFLQKRDPGRPIATIDGQACIDQSAIDRAAGLLLAARRPVVLGLVGTSLEA
jgi:formylmethanofuran dehydrogenase subunit B